jgi:DNA-binding NtrC family response regulator
VRELEAFVERLLVAAGEHETLQLQDWALEHLTTGGAREPTGPGAASEPGDEASESGAAGRRRAKTPRPTRVVLEECLLRCDGSVRAAAASLGVARRTLYRWLEALGVDPERYRAP